MRTDYQLVQLHFDSSIYNGEIVKLQFALNDDYNNIPHLKANDWKIVSQNLYSYVHFRAVLLIHSALQRNAATLRKVLANFSLSHVIDACSLLSLFSLSLSPFFFHFLDFIVINDFVFNKTITLRASIGSIIRYPARPRRIIIKYIYRRLTALRANKGATTPEGSC